MHNEKKHSKSSFDVLFGDTRRGDNSDLGIRRGVQFWFGDMRVPKGWEPLSYITIFCHLAIPNWNWKYGQSFQMAPPILPPFFQRLKNAKNLWNLKPLWKLWNKRKLSTSKYSKCKKKTFLKKIVFLNFYKTCQCVLQIAIECLTNIRKSFKFKFSNSQNNWQITNLKKAETI